MSKLVSDLRSTQLLPLNQFLQDQYQLIGIKSSLTIEISHQFNWVFDVFNL